MLKFATALDLARFIHGDTATAAQAPDGAEMLLRHASMTIRRATRNALYDIDADGYPTDSEVSAAFRDATCAQAWAASELKVNPATGSAGVTAEVTTKSLGSASVSYSVNNMAAAYRDGVANGRYLSPMAYGILSDAGLIEANVSEGYPRTTVLEERPVDITTGRFV